MRMKLAGTIWAVVTRSVSMRARHCAASQRAMITTVAPSPRLMRAYALGAVWYMGPHMRWTSSGPKPQNVAKGLGGVSRAGVGGGWAMPLARPGVPEVYGMAMTGVPRNSSVGGSAVPVANPGAVTSRSAVEAWAAAARATGDPSWTTSVAPESSTM